MKINYIDQTVLVHMSTKQHDYSGNTACHSFIVHLAQSKFQPRLGLRQAQKLKTMQYALNIWNTKLIS